MNRSGWQVSYGVLREALRGRLVAVLKPGSDGPDQEGISSLRNRACAVVYELLSDHPVDRHGRCRSCRRPGAVFGFRRRRCRVYITVNYWLRQPDTALVAHLTREFGNRAAPANPPVQPVQTPAVPPSLLRHGLPVGAGQ